MKKKWLTRGLLVAVLTCVAVMVGITGCKKDKPADKEPVSSKVNDDGKRSIADFESLEELYTMSFRNEFGKVELNQDKEYITSGDCSAKLTIAGKKNDTSEYERVWIHVPVNSKFTDTEELKDAKALCVDVYSLSDEPLEIALNMNFKNNHYGDQTPFAKQTIQKGKNTLRFDILVGVWDWETKVSELQTLDFVIGGRSTESEKPIIYMDNFHYELADKNTSSQYEIYKGGLDFNGEGKYVTEDFLWFRGGLTGAVLSQPIVENGELTTTVQGTPVAFCFAAEDELQSYEPGDNIQVTMRAKFTNENGKFGYLTGTEEWNNISDLGTVDKDGYRTFSFVTTVNDYVQSYMYLEKNESDKNYKEFKNLAFSIHYDFDMYMPDEEGNMPQIAIDYVTIEPIDKYTGDWSFNGQNGAVLRDYMRATGLANSQPYVRNGILKFSIYKGSSSIRFSAEPLLKKGYKIGDTVTLKMRIKVNDVEHLKMCTAEWGVESFDNFTKMTSMPDDAGYYIVTFDAKINAKDSSFMYDSKAKSTDWANICFTLLPTNQDKKDWPRDIEIDYIEVIQKYTGDWTFNNMTGYCLSDYVRISGNRHTQPQVSDGALKFTIYNGSSSIRFSADSLLKKGYKVGDTVTLKMRMKVNDTENLKICTDEWGVEDFSKFTQVTNMPDDEGYCIITFDAKINGKDSDYMYDPKSPTSDFANIAFSLLPTNKDKTAWTRDVVIDYIEIVQKYAGDWSFDNKTGYCLSDYVRLSGNRHTQPQVSDGTLKFTIYNGSSSIRFSAHELLQKGYKVGDTVTLKMRMKVNDTANSKICTEAFGLEEFNKFEDVATKMDADGYYELIFNTKINQKDSDHMYDSKSLTTDFANIAITLLPSNQDKNAWTRDVEIDYIKVVEEYEGDLTFDGKGGYAFYDYVRTTASKLPKTVKNGNLYFNYIGMTSARFSAEELLANGYKIGDQVKVTMRMKINNAKDVNICTEALGVEKWNALTNVGKLDSEGYYILTYTTTINEKDSEFIYDKRMDTTDWANIAFTLHSTKDRDLREIAIDYIKVEHVDPEPPVEEVEPSTSWEFEDADEKLNIHINSASETLVADGKLSVTSRDGWSAIRFSAANLIAAGYEVGDDIRVTMRIKPASAGSCTFYGAPYGSGWTNGTTAIVVNDMLQETCAIRATKDAEGYYIFTYATKINAKDSDWLNSAKESDAEWSNVGIMFNFGNAQIKNVLIDYIRVDEEQDEGSDDEVEVSTNWEFDDASAQLDMHKNSASETVVADGKLSVTSSNAWSALRFSAANLLSAGYKVGDDIRVTMRIKPANAGVCTFYGAPYGSGWTNGTTAIVVNDMLQDTCAIRATKDAEGYYIFTYATKINAKDSDWLNDAKANDAEWANVGIMFNFGNATTKNVLIDYIKVEKPEAFSGWNFDDANAQLDMHKNDASTVSVTDGKLSVTSGDNGWSALRFSAANLLSSGYKVGDNIRVTMRIKPANAGICTFYGAPYGSGWTNGTTCFVVNDMLQETCAIRATKDAEGYYTFSYETKINAKDSDWLNVANANDAEWANVGLMFNFGNATTKNVLIDYIKVEKVPTVSLLMQSRIKMLFGVR